MATRSRRLNLTLDAQLAAKLRQLAERMHMNEGSLARALLSQALDDAEANPRDVVAVLDRIPGAPARTDEGPKQARSRRTIDLEGLITPSKGDPLDLGAPLKPVKGVPLPSEELAAMREAER